MQGRSSHVLFFLPTCMGGRLLNIKVCYDEKCNANISERRLCFFAILNPKNKLNILNLKSQKNIGRSEHLECIFSHNTTLCLSWLAVGGEDFFKFVFKKI